jgi:hypothetical protein
MLPHRHVAAQVSIEINFWKRLIMFELEWLKQVRTTWGQPRVNLVSTWGQHGFNLGSTSGQPAPPRRRAVLRVVSIASYTKLARWLSFRPKQCATKPISNISVGSSRKRVW